MSRYFLSNSGFLAAGFFAVDSLAAGFLAAGFLAMDFVAAGFLAAGFFAVDLLPPASLFADFFGAVFFAAIAGGSVAAAAANYCQMVQGGSTRLNNV